MSALRTFVTAQISFNRLLSALYKIEVKVDPSEVDKKYQEVTKDPRLKPVTVYEIIEITLPVRRPDFKDHGDHGVTSFTHSRVSRKMNFWRWLKKLKKFWVVCSARTSNGIL